MTADGRKRVLGWDEARARVLEGVAPLEPETRPLLRACGAALRCRVVAPHPLPPFRNAAMDGWAVRTADLAAASAHSPVTLPVVGALAAGATAPRPLAPGEAMLIMTGAMLPEGADAVVPFEDGERLGADGSAAMRAVRAPRAGEHMREAGVDLAAGELALAEGRELSAHDLALAASLGLAELRVGPAPRVAVLSTGDELLAPGEPLRPGAIRDSNMPMLAVLCEQAGAHVVIAERLADDAARVGERIGEALAVADVVLTIGGISAGDYDPVKQALAAYPDVELWHVEMRPGRPQAFGRPNGRIFHALPGNPASVACVFEALVRPVLRRLQGFASLERPRVPVRIAQAIESREGRTDFLRCTLEWRDGLLWASPAGVQVSGHLAPQSRAHALVIVPASAPALAANAPAEAWLLRAP